MKMNMKWGFAKSVGVFIVGLMLGGCFGPPDDVIEAAIINAHPSLKANFYRLTEYEVINSYDHELGGETVYVVEYVAGAVPRNAAPGAKIETINGTVYLVERGSAWYAE